MILPGKKRKQIWQRQSAKRQRDPLYKAAHRLLERKRRQKQKEEKNSQKHKVTAAKGKSQDYAPVRKGDVLQEM